MKRLFAVLASASVIATLLVWGSDGTANAGTTCYNQDNSSPGFVVKDRECSFDPRGIIGGTFSGVVVWHYKGNAVNAETGVIDGSVTETRSGGCLTLRLVWAPSTTSGFTQSRIMAQSCAVGDKKAQNLPYDINVELGMTHTDGEFRLQLGWGGDWTNIWRQRVAATPYNT